MNNKRVKILSMILIFISIFFIGNFRVLADSTDFSLDGIKNEADNWVNGATSPISPEEISKIVTPIANILLGIGSVVIVAAFIILGIKYLSVSPNEQGKIKSQLIGLTVSAVVLYGAYGIWSIVYKVLNGVFG